MSEWLEVKNWETLQHYKKRNPPWIKLYRRLLTDGDFNRLTEPEQWQLVRIWIASSENHPGGWVPNDENWLRRMTGSLRAVPVKKFVKEGWLIPRDASAHASAVASTAASTEVEIDPITTTPEVQRYINPPSFLPTSTTDVANAHTPEGLEGLNIGGILKEVDAP